jgi:hypothetical protein
MSDWFFEHALVFVDKEHPAKTAARVVAILFAILPLVAFIALLFDAHPSHH